MAPILNSTTGILPQVLESVELIELLRHLNALGPLPISWAPSTASVDESRCRGDDKDNGNDTATPSHHDGLLPLVLRLTELLHPYQDHWSFDETVRSFFCRLVWIVSLVSNMMRKLTRFHSIIKT